MARQLIKVDASSPFTIYNIPFGIFSTASEPRPRPATVLGDQVLDLRLVENQGLFRGISSIANGKSPVEHGAGGDGSMFSGTTLNTFASCDKRTRVLVRERIIELLSDLKSPIYSDDALRPLLFTPLAETTMHLPMEVGGFTDFLTSRVHAQNCAEMAGQRLHESFDHFPTAYNGRASSLVVSGTPVRRPRGMVRPPGQANYTFEPSCRLDFELEMGIFISKPVPYGKMVTAEEAADNIFGLVLLNDWSSRDIQFAEMIPLGPFNGKGTATSISPWIIMPEALAISQSMTTSDQAREMQPKLAPHLKQKLENSTWDIDLKVAVVPSGTTSLAIVCQSNLKHGYWSPAQMIAHHSSAGCGLNTGDLIGTGTLSGPDHSKQAPSLGCLHELNRAGTVPIQLSGTQKQKEMMWLSDGDEVIFSGWAGTGEERVGFGDLTGTIMEPF